MQDHHSSSIDLTQFYQIFFEEAIENLDQMEQMLLDLDLQAADDEELNAVFRCAHSIKGGAATFGFSDVAELTHQMESLLDKLRRHELQPSPPMVDVLLESSDALRGLLARHQGVTTEAPVTTSLVERIRVLASGQAPVEAPSVAAPAQASADRLPPTPTVAAIRPPASPGLRHLEIHVGPMEQPEQADAVTELFRDIPGLGSIQVLPNTDPSQRCFAVETTSTDSDLIDLFAFHVAKEHIRILDARAAIAPPEPEAADFGLFDDAPGLPPVAASASAAAPAPIRPAMAPAPVRQQAPVAAEPSPPVATVTPSANARADAKAAAHPPAQLEASTLRVAVSKVDQLINLVGELVITQAMLAQNSRSLDPALNQQLLAGLADLDRNTRDLQESVMSIRMIPMSVVFSRFPRMLRDLAGKLGKKVELVTHGEATELDKGLIEKITDPLTHLIRNSCDHGIEMPYDRVAVGKPEQGTVTLSASHQGGSVLIEVRDDGRGLDKAKLLSKARDKGLDVPDNITDSDAWQLIFAPGFSTADVVTDVSGRGVGMDVVKKNITALNGTVEIESRLGKGMRVIVRLPLTLAIMDGMTVRVAKEVYILPLSSVIESFQLQNGEINSVVQGGQLVKVRDEYMPVVELERVFNVPRHEVNNTNSIMVVVEAEGSRVAVMVDELLGQQQVVIKNLESNYRKVPNVSGATILGDGKVALILDTSGLIRRSRH